MREILFRGRSIETRLWYYGGIINTDFEEPPYVPAIVLRDDFGYTLIDVDPDTVEQFTGLTDKNGKKIFEGDILIVGNCRKHPVLVKFIEFSWQCVIPNVNAYIGYRHRLENNETKYEVIGNIHDNPELLEV